jgi:hypothetical protein
MHIADVITVVASKARLKTFGTYRNAKKAEAIEIKDAAVHKIVENIAGARVRSISGFCFV